MLEYCTPFSHRILIIAYIIEAVQRIFTKRITGLSSVNYFDCLHYLGLESLELRRLKYDLVMCLKICHGDTDIEVKIVFQCNTVTRGDILYTFKTASTC